MEYIKLITNSIQNQITVFFLKKEKIELFDTIFQKLTVLQKHNLLVICFDFESKQHSEKLNIKNFTFLNNPNIENITDYTIFTLYKISETSKKDIIYFDLDYSISNEIYSSLTNDNYFNAIFFSTNDEIGNYVERESIFSENNEGIESYLTLSPVIIKIRYNFETVTLFQEIFKENNIDWKNFSNIVEKYLIQNKILITKSHHININYEMLLKNNQIIGIINEKVNK
jgi:hypothetical protein